MYMVLAAVFGGLADKFVGFAPRHTKPVPLDCMLCLVKGTRGFIVSGFLITGVAFFFIGPGNFITTP